MYPLFRSVLLSGVLFFTFSSLLFGKDPVRYVKKSHKVAYNSIKEWSYRTDPVNKKVQKAELELQASAFMKIAEAMGNNIDDKFIGTIEVALLRWGWLEGDPVLDNPHQVDYYMVWMELRQKLPSVFPTPIEMLK